MGTGVLRRATGRFTRWERTDIWGQGTVCRGRGPCELSHSAPLFLALLNSVVAKTVFKLALERRGGEREGWGERPCLSLEADQLTPSLQVTEPQGQGPRASELPAWRSPNHLVCGYPWSKRHLPALLSVNEGRWGSCVVSPQSPWPPGPDPLLLFSWALIFWFGSAASCFALTSLEGGRP